MEKTLGRHRAHLSGYLGQMVPKPLAGADGMVCSCLQHWAFFSVLMLTPPDKASQRMYPLCSADGRPTCSLKPRGRAPERNKLRAYYRTSRAVSFTPALPSPRCLGWRSIFFFPEYHLKWQGLFQKNRSGTTLNCPCPTLAQLFLRLLNYSQRTRYELLWGSGSRTLCTAAQVVHCSTLGGRVPLTQTPVYKLQDCRWVALLQNLGHNGRQLGKPLSGAARLSLLQ